MPAVDFPSSPTNGQSFTSGGKTWVYNGTGWALVAPGGSAGGDLTGTYPNPTIGSGKVTAGDVTGSVVVLLDSQTFTSSTTYSVPANAKILIVEMWNAGGGGQGGSQQSFGFGGCGGTMIRRVLTSSEASGSVTVTIGAGGTAGSLAQPGRGGASRFGPMYGVGGTGGNNPGSPNLGGFLYRESAGATADQPGGSVAYIGGKTGYRCGGGGGPAGDWGEMGYAGGAYATDPDTLFQTAFSWNTSAGGGGGAGGGANGVAGSAGGAKQGGGGGGGQANGGAGGAPSGGGGGGGGGADTTGGVGGRGEIKIWVYG